MQNMKRKYFFLRGHGGDVIRLLVAIVLLYPSIVWAAGNSDRKRSRLEAPTSDSGVSDSDRGARSDTVHEGVTGVVLDASGVPVADVLVQPSSLDGSSPIPEMAVMTGPDGHFTWKLQPGRYRLDVIVDGRAIASAGVTVRRGSLSSIRLRAGG